LAQSGSCSRVTNIHVRLVVRLYYFKIILKQGVCVERGSCFFLQQLIMSVCL